MTVKASAAPIDPDCREVFLGPATSACVLRLMPRYKSQSVGGMVFYQNNVVVESAAQPRNFLHATPGLRGAQSAVPDPSDPALPKQLRRAPTAEANLSASFSTFKVARRMRPDPAAGALGTGTPFRLFHAQAEAFAAASCDGEKGRTVGSVDGALPPAVREGGLRMHLPYLKPLAAASEGDASPEPTDPAAHSAKQLFVFEPLSRSISTGVGWRMDVRVRHLGSGKYLAVSTDPPPPEGAESGGGGGGGGGGAAGAAVAASGAVAATREPCGQKTT